MAVSARSAASELDPRTGVARGSSYRWTVVALLFAATTINYMDRQVLGILAPTLQRDLRWSETDYGAIVSWFSLAYGAGLLLMGGVLDRIGARLGFLVGDYGPESRGDGARAGSHRWRILDRASGARSRRGREFSWGCQSGRRMVSEARASARDRVVQRREQCRRDRRADCGAVDCTDVGLAMGIHRHRRSRVPIPTLFAPYAKSLWLAVSIVSVAAAAHQFWSCNLFTTVSDMFPRRAVASVVGIGGFVGAMSAMGFQRLTGYILEATGSNYRIIFVICAVVYVGALVLFHLLVPRMLLADLDGSSSD